MSSISTFDEETARAEVYGLLAALFYAPPTPELLAQLREIAAMRKLLKSTKNCLVV
jgi:TorA maturation chaperone TorD